MGSDPALSASAMAALPDMQDHDSFEAWMGQCGVSLASSLGTDTEVLGRSSPAGGWTVTGGVVILQEANQCLPVELWGRRGLAAHSNLAQFTTCPELHAAHPGLHLVAAPSAVREAMGLAGLFPSRPC